jgi:hypothetical protein
VKLAFFYVLVFYPEVVQEQGACRLADQHNQISIGSEYSAHEAENF